jgi:hypothetical protein
LDFFYFYQIANTTIKSYQEKSSIKALKNGGFVIAWNCNECDGNNYGVSMQIFDQAAGKIGNEILVNKFITGIQRNPKIATLNNNNFAVIWEGQNYLNSQIFSVYCKIFSATGSILLEEFVVSELSIDTHIISDKVENLFIIVYTARYIITGNFGCYLYWNIW